MNDSCIGSGICESVAPDLFTVGDDERARLLMDPVPDGALGGVRDAAASCPMAAIAIGDGQR
ncbi:ferredoxin [Amycolatopsis thermophila]|uniref:Ferredoxin n=1 Tax=Amycolatopsis thermophila TaxID=206084 RepID=A0ABU0EYC9_9PSEU|nr:ferredoxin [Amycolatopsis thermophila]MDQ0380328.1 ferredoxin [Amycolatopsis thermophila]